jgi:hypothetical protein
MGSEPFWKLQTTEEMRLVHQILVDRFPVTYQRLSDSLDLADPFDIFHPGNPGEYSDVVQEVVVLLAPVGGDFSALDRAGLSAVLRDGLARCFEEPPDEARFERLVDLLSEI